MKYIYFEFEGEKSWIEIDKDGYASRQIGINADDDVFLSCFENYLAEGKIELDEGVMEFISQCDFEKIWNAHTDEYRPRWEQAKITYPIGKTIEARIRCFYPQGIIFDIDYVYGVADYEECRANSLAINLYPLHKIIGDIVGYDDVNMWLKLGNSKAL